MLHKPHTLLRVRRVIGEDTISPGAQEVKRIRTCTSTDFCFCHSSIGERNSSLFRSDTFTTSGSKYARPAPELNGLNDTDQSIRRYLLLPLHRPVSVWTSIFLCGKNFRLLLCYLLKFEE